MTNNRFFNHCLICALIFITGLGLVWLTVIAVFVIMKSQGLGQSNNVKHFIFMAINLFVYAIGYFGFKQTNIFSNLNVDIKKNVDNIFQNIISKTFQHFFRALQLYLDKEDNEDYNNLFYFFNDNKQIRVHTENSFESRKSMPTK